MFPNVTAWKIPEGDVAIIVRGAEILWQKPKLPMEYQEVERLLY